MNIFELSSRQAALTFLLSAAYRTIYQGKKLVVEHSFADGYFCHRDNWEPITQGEADVLEQKVKSWLKNDTPLIEDEVDKPTLLNDYKKIGLRNKTEIITQWDVEKIPVIRFGRFSDYRFEPMCLDKKKLINFRLMSYDHGMLIRFPSVLNHGSIPDFHDHPHLFEIIDEYEKWGNVLNIESIRDLNEAVRNNSIRELMWVAEGLHEKKIGNIADELSNRFPTSRVISIAGPSSSGKTSFAKRLSIQLRVNGFTTKQMSMDDYFCDRDDIPVDENGEQDFEAFEILNNELLCDDLQRLLNGEAINRRKYNFTTGRGSVTNDEIMLKENDFIILEGIHGLNPLLTNNIADGNVSKIYVSAITQLNIDADHRFSTSDNRLLRRMVRDYKFRNYSPTETISRWHSVRLGEERNIFPYQDNADFFFNSALIYELPVLAGDVKPLLELIEEGNRFDDQIHRLKTLLSFFIPLEEEIVPGISILREFIGKSEFNY